MKIKLIKGSRQYQEQIIEMLKEWSNYNATHDTKRSPWAIFKNGTDDFDHYLSNLEVREPRDGLVPDSTFFYLDVERNILVGSVNIRHSLNEQLLAQGGHIGDGIRPSERRKGYATQMIRLALEECRRLGIKKVLMVCDKNNIDSAKSIIRNGEVLENEQLVNGQGGAALDRFSLNPESAPCVSGGILSRPCFVCASRRGESTPDGADSHLGNPKRFVGDFFPFPPHHALGQTPAFSAKLFRNLFRRIAT